MYDEIWSIIQGGDYRLEELSYKIDVLWLAGQLTKDQRDNLRALAQEQAKPDSERPALEARLETLAAQLAALTDRVAALEQGGTGEEPGGGGQEEPDYPDWQPWDGISKDYQYGAIVRHNGQLWQSPFRGQNVWEPGVLGTEALWVKYTPA